MANFTELLETYDIVDVGIVMQYIQHLAIEISGIIRYLSTPVLNDNFKQKGNSR